MDEGGSVDKHPSLGRGSVGGLMGDTSLGTLEDMLRKSLDAGISLHRGPFPVEGNLVCRGHVYRGL